MFTGEIHHRQRRNAYMAEHVRFGIAKNGNLVSERTTFGIDLSGSAVVGGFGKLGNPVLRTT